jgi:2-C-methyl-D-erythritol 4-phosphate cytidylyltransferase/2-C-methyl-D-erythritol 2,4-cyclodiphosphate synthase
MIRDTTGIILAGGVGSRMGTATPKQYLRVGGRRVIDYSIDVFLEALGQVIVVIPDVAHAGDLPRDDRLEYVAGGASRTDSIGNGLARVTTPYVFLHDAARPFVTTEILRDLREGLERFVAACPVLPVVNTVVVDHAGRLADTPDRATFREVQTPQAFHTDWLRRALHERRDEHAHIPELIRRMGADVVHIDGSPWLFKITYEPSLYAAERYASGYRARRKHEGA